MGFWLKVLAKAIQIVAAGIIAVGIEKSFINDDDDKERESTLRREISAEIKRLLENDASLNSAMTDLKSFTIIVIAIFIAIIVLSTAAKLYGDVIVRRATKKSEKKKEIQGNYFNSFKLCVQFVT